VSRYSSCSQGRRSQFSHEGGFTASLGRLFAGCWLLVARCWLLDGWLDAGKPNAMKGSVDWSSVEGEVPSIYRVACVPSRGGVL
jgi:hypothetical protein